MPVHFSDENIDRLFGKEAAENEDPRRLSQYFFKNRVYESIQADLQLRILVAHKGIGKSAMFKICHLEDIEAGRLSIWIRPDDLYAGDFPDTDEINPLVAYWKRNLLEIIARKIVQFAQISDDSSVNRILNFVKGNFIAGLVDFLSNELPNVKEAAAKSIVEHFIRNRRIMIYIDDLDRGWQGRVIDIRRISALLNALRDLTTDYPSLYFRVGLRGDVYFLVRTSDESTDKIEQSIIWYQWSNHEIFKMLVKRVAAYFGKDYDDKALAQMQQRNLAAELSEILDEKFVGRGHWENAPMHKVLLSLVRKRPRDLIKLCSGAAKLASLRGHGVIRTQDLVDSFPSYSQERLQDAINEFRSELANIDALLLNMKPSQKERKAALGYTYTTAELLQKISTIKARHKFELKGRPYTDERGLAQFLYKICFITARKELSSGFIDRKYFDDNPYLAHDFVDFGYDWEIHPAYRWALQPDSIDTIYQSLKLTDA